MGIDWDKDPVRYDYCTCGMIIWIVEEVVNGLLIDIIILYHRMVMMECYC